MPSVMDEDWLLRLRAKLGMKTVGVAKLLTPVMSKQKPLEADLPLAKESCPHPAGSLQKIEAMRQRVERGEAVFHPNDNRDIVIRNNARVG